MSEKGLAEKHWNWIKELLEIGGNTELNRLHEFLFLEGWKHGVKHYQQEQTQRG